MFAAFSVASFLISLDLGPTDGPRGQFLQRGMYVESLKGGSKFAIGANNFHIRSFGLAASLQVFAAQAPSEA